MTKKAKMVTPKGVAIFPNITKEGEYEGKKTGKYDCKLRLDPSNKADAAFIDRCEEIVNEKIDNYLDKLKSSDKKKYSIQSKWDRRSPFVPELDDNGEENGMVTIKFTRGVDKGMPLIVDAKKVQIKKPPVITGGSVLRVAYAIGGAYAMPSGKFLGVPFYMNAVQLIELGSFGGSADDFDEEDGFEYDEDAFDSTPPFDDGDEDEEDDDF